MNALVVASGCGDALAVRTADFDFDLPAELIAQSPAPDREGSRLLVLDRAAGRTEHRMFRDLPGLLVPGDVLVLNNSRVIPARLRGSNSKTGGRFEILLLEQNRVNDWWVMLRPGKRARVGTEIILDGRRQGAEKIRAEVVETNAEGHRRLEFCNTADILRELDSIGEVPLPPYIVRGADGPADTDRSRYQTVYADPPGSVAAPTAGLHFSEALLAKVRERGVILCTVTLHVGLGTFAPVKTERITAHTMHEERFELPERTAREVNEAKRERRRVIAVGTTSVRVLETAGTGDDGPLAPGAGRTRIFLHPPCRFKMVDALLTNFHLPRSTLLMLVSAFAEPGGNRGRDLVIRAYREAIERRYRFFSYGDAMLLV